VPFTNLRNIAIIRLSNELGLKLIEIANIDFGDVHLTPEDEYPMDRLQTLTGEEMEYLRTTYFRPHLHLRTGKREQVVRGISPETVRILREYMQTRLRSRMRLGKWRYGDELALFVTRSGERVTRHALSELHLEVRKAAGIKKRRGGFEASRRGRIS
jgi:site-specific recombinase XerD